MRKQQPLSFEAITNMKTGGINEACMRYGIGRDSMRALAEEAHAIIRVGKRLIVNFSIVDAYMDSISE